MGKRIILYVKDLVVLTGKGYENCRKEYKAVKDALGKKEHQNLTIKEYCDYEGIKEDEVHKSLGI